MAIQILVFSPKGGVGKTTSAINIAAELTKAHGKKVLLVDCDPNVSLSGGLSLKNHPAKMFTKMCIDWIVADEESDINDAICETAWSGLDIMPSTNKLSSKAETLLGDDDAGTEAFSCLFGDLEDEYDFIIYDAAGSKASPLTENAIRVADYQLVPFDNSIDGLNHALNVGELIEGYRKKLNRNFKFLGTFLSAEERNNITKTIKEAAQETFQDEYLGTVQRRAAIKNASAAMTPICYYEPKSDAAADYAELTVRILERIQEEN